MEATATAALALRDHDPVAAREQAEAVRRRAVKDGQGAAEAIALRTLALSELDLGSPKIAERFAARAVTAAGRCDRPDVLAGCRTSHAGVLFLLGRHDDAQRVIALAARCAPPEMRSDVLTQRAWMLLLAGRWSEALSIHEALLAAHPPLAPTQRAEVLSNHGMLLSELSRHDDALDAFAEAIACIGDVDSHAALVTRHNRALCLSMAGRLSESLHEFAAVERRLRDAPIERAWLLVGQADALLRANLAAEALPVARRAVDVAGRTAPLELRAEAWWRAARAARLVGHRDEAIAAARHARTLFTKVGSSAQAAMARHEELVAAGRSGRRALADLTANADDLHRAGRAEPAAMARVDALEVALRLGDMDASRRLRRQLGVARRRSTAVTRAACELAEARWRDAHGDPANVLAAVRSGLSILDDHRAALGATELRAHASGLGAELVDIGLGAALRTGRPSAVLQLIERWRAGTVMRRPVPTGELAEALADLRRATDDRDSSTERVRALEVRVRRLARQAQLSDDAGITLRTDPPSLASLRAHLNGATLMEIVELPDRYHAVIVDERGARLVQLGDVDDVARAQRDLTFGLRRLARSGISQSAASAAAASVDESLSRLAGALLPACVLRTNRPIVVVPPAALHTVPWSSLPALVERDVSVAPSATWWLAAANRQRNGRGTSRVALIAGPRLAGAADEVGALARIYPGAAVLEPWAADERRVLHALDGCDLAHLACHAHLRADHPHLSSFELADGPFTVYDLERLSAAPRDVVLSACDSGVSSVRPGDELLGFLTALFSLGTRRVLASVVPVPDLATSPLMVSFHEALGAGAGFAAALRSARSTLDLSRPDHRAVAASFVTFGRD
jgi:CHAT domain-containing protein/tetratricopeptide (TPR) repeat protein